VDKIYKKIEIVGTSSESFEKAVEAGIKKASETLRNLDWFEVIEQRGRIENGHVAQYQATLRVGFRLD
jgi:flavin-binding protein dodecin